jgi:hypothetical protein
MHSEAEALAGQAGAQPLPGLRPDVKLIGRLEGSGYHDDQWLIDRGGTFIQVPELLYRMIEQLGAGDRTASEVAVRITETSPWAVTADQVEHVARTKLNPLGLLQPGGADAEAAEPGPARPAQSPFRLALKRRFLGPRAVQPVAGVLKWLFHPAVIAVVLALATAMHVWLYAVRGATGSLTEIINHPGLILVIFVTVVAAAWFHEWGHAAALVYGGGRVRGMGAGFYVIFPAFYTDVTDGYRLPRRARVRTDLGGPYFHLIFALLVAAIAMLTGQPFWLFAVVLIDVEILRQFVPFVRLDGYWLLADLTGIPDLFSNIVPFARGMFRRHGGGDRTLGLRPAARLTFLAYLLVTAVILPVMFAVAVTRLPQLISLAWLSLTDRAQAVAAAWRAGSPVGVAAGTVEVVLLGVELLGFAVFAYLFLVRPVWTAWATSRTQPAPVRRLLGAAGLLCAGGLLMVLGALLPWQFIGSLLFIAVNGVATGWGWLVLALGLSTIAAAGFMILSRWRVLRIVAMAGSAAFATLAIAVSVVQFHHISGQNTVTVREGITQSLGRAPTRQEMAAAERMVQTFGLSVQPWAGLYVCAAGGGLAVLGAVSAAFGERYRRDPGVPDADHVLPSNPIGQAQWPAPEAAEAVD